MINLPWRIEVDLLHPQPNPEDEDPIPEQITLVREDRPGLWQGISLVLLFYVVFSSSLFVLSGSVSLPVFLIAQTIGWIAAIGAAALSPRRDFLNVFSRGSFQLSWLPAIALFCIGGTYVLFWLSFYATSGITPEPTVIDPARSVAFGLLSSILVAPVAEELFFREWMLRGFLRRYSTRNAILLNALIFSVFHLEPYQIAPAFFAGIFFGWLYLRTRSVWSSICAHSLGNLTAFLPYSEKEEASEWFEFVAMLSCAAVGGIGIFFLSRKKE